MIKKISITMVILVLWIGGVAQYKSKSDVHIIGELKVINEELFPVLDTIIKMKSETTFYKNGSLFTMWFGLDSIKPDLITIWAEGEKISGTNHDLGLFDYKGNTFFVRGVSLDTTIFVRTKSKRKIDFSVSNIIVQNDGTIVFDLNADKRYCIWTCRYNCSKFKLLSFESFDKKIPSFNIIEQEYQQEKSHRPSPKLH